MKQTLTQRIKKTPIPEKIKCKHRLVWGSCALCYPEHMIKNHTPPKKFFNIPEKIKIANVSPENIVVAEYLNSLIDALTEQQKEIEDLKEINAKQPSYTAMRSTGEFCVCPSPMQCNCLLNGNKCGECHSCHKLLKPQEDVLSKVANYLRKHTKHPDKAFSKLSEDILAIVKGE